MAIVVAIVPPHGLQLAPPSLMGVVSVVLRHECKPSWSRYHAVSFSHSPPLAIYLSISICEFVWLSLNNSNSSSHSLSLFLLHLLSLYLSRSLPPLSLNGAMVPTVVQLWYYMQYRILTPLKDLSFSAHLSVEFGTTHVLGYLSTLQKNVTSTSRNCSGHRIIKIAC